MRAHEYAQVVSFEQAKQRRREDEAVAAGLLEPTSDADLVKGLERTELAAEMLMPRKPENAGEESVHEIGKELDQARTHLFAGAKKAERQSLSSTHTRLLILIAELDDCVSELAGHGDAA